MPDNGYKLCISMGPLLLAAKSSLARPDLCLFI